MRRMLRFTGCVATAALGLALTGSAVAADEPPVEENNPSLQDAAEAAAQAAAKATEGVAEEAAEAAREAAEDAVEAAQEAAEEAAAAAQEAAQQAVEQAAQAAEEVAAKVAEQAQQAAESTADAARKFAEQAHGKAARMLSGFHLGLQITSVPRALDAQLKLDGKGVLVDGVTKDSPAEKAGIQPNDVLLSVYDAPVASAKDLHKVLQASEGKEIKIKLLRGGESQEVTVTPQKIETSGSIILDLRAPKREEVDIEIRKLEEKIREKLKDAGLDVRMQLLRPGHILPSGDKLFIKTRMPDDVEIQIIKKGEAPAKIEIKQGEKTWSVTEDKLDELPEEVRPYAERMLSHGPVPFTVGVPGMPGRPGRPGVTFHTPEGKIVTSEGESIVIHGPDRTPQSGKRELGSLERRIERLSDEIEQVSEKMDRLRDELKAQAERGKD